MPVDEKAGVVAGSKKGESAEEIFEGRAADETGEKETDAKLPFNEHPRWKQVYGENKEYKELGTPAELKEKLGKLSKVDEYESYIAHLNEKIEKLETKKDEDEPKSDKQKQFEQLRKQARAELAKIAPEIDSIAKQQTEWDIYYASLERQAYKETAVVLEKAGLSAGQKDVNETAAVLADIIGADQDLYLEYRTNPREAVREAWGRLTKRYNVERGVKADIERDKKNLEKLPKPHVGAGSSELGIPKEAPKTLKEAERRAKLRLASLKE